MDVCQVITLHPPTCYEREKGNWIIRLDVSISVRVRPFDQYSDEINLFLHYTILSHRYTLVKTLANVVCESPETKSANT